LAVQKAHRTTQREGPGRREGIRAGCKNRARIAQDTRGGHQAARKIALSRPAGFPPVSARLRVASALQVVFAKLPTGNATLALKPGALVITTIGRTTVVRLLGQRVWVQFERRPCVDALGDLFELTGVPVVVDNRVLAQARRPVTATFANGAALGTVLPLVPEMAGLKLLVVGNALYVQSPAHARLLEEEVHWRLRESLLLAAQENALAQQWWMSALLASRLSARPRR
jgi:hypothetical protein